jgi:hypothetical protein
VPKFPSIDPSLKTMAFPPTAIRGFFEAMTVARQMGSPLSINLFTRAIMFISIFLNNHYLSR